MKLKTWLAGWITLFLATVMAAETKADILYVSGVYSQNFDSLSAGPSNTNLTWTNNSTLSGWYSNRTTYRVSSGGDGNGALYSFGSASASERALGSLASGTTGTILYGVGLLNNSASTFNSVTVTYDGEQWRNGGNTANHALTFDYQIGTGLTIGAGGYTAVPSLDFTGPVATGTAGSLDGNAAANRVAGIAFTVTGINWAPGQQLYLRWTDLNDGGNDHGLGIDNFSFSANAIPEPAATVLIGMVLVAGTLFRRRRR